MVAMPIFTTSQTRSSSSEPKVLITIFCCFSVGRDKTSLTVSDIRTLATTVHEHSDLPSQLGVCWAVDTGSHDSK